MHDCAYVCMDNCACVSVCLCMIYVYRWVFVNVCTRVVVYVHNCAGVGRYKCMTVYVGVCLSMSVHGECEYVHDYMYVDMYITVYVCLCVFHDCVCGCVLVHVYA